MALRTCQEIAGNIQNAMIRAIMADETADVSIKEQLVICILTRTCIHSEVSVRLDFHKVGN